MDALQAYDWPGNVRELANAIEYALVLGDPDCIQLHNLPLRIQEHYGHVDSSLLEADDLDGTLGSIEARHILEAMQKEGGNRTHAAKLLGITRRALGYRLHKYGLDIPSEEGDNPTQRASLKVTSKDKKRTKGQGPRSASFRSES
jgi:two-component system response regulator AtoC